MRLRAKRVAFSYPSGVRALEEIDLDVNSGEAVALIGPNGAGKTTLVKHFNGLLKPTEGQVYVGDWDTQAHSVAELATRVGFAFQNPGDQIFKRSVRDEVAFGPMNLGFTEDRVALKVDEFLELLGLIDASDEHPYDLNPSDRKLLTIAGVLAMDTPVVILDEPTTGQDARGLGRIASVVEGLRASGRTLILISHDLDFCAENLDRVIAVQDGRIVGSGSKREILADVSFLEQAGLEPPQLIRLSEKIGIHGAPITPEAFFDEYLERCSRSNRSST